MKRSKKLRHPITGQHWYEKLLDWMTREENFRWSMIFLGIYVAIMLWGCLIFANLLEWSNAATPLRDAWFMLLPLVVFIAIVNPCSGFWGLRACNKLQKTILDYIEQHGSQTYDVLVSQCMPIKIHLGVDDALDRLLCSHKLVLYTDEQGKPCYRLPTEEDRTHWRQEYLASCGAKVSFEDFNRLFSSDSDEMVYAVEFSIGTDDFYLGWYAEQPDDTKKIWQCGNGHSEWEFTSFQELIGADLFHGSSLQTIWDDVILISVDNIPASECFAPLQ